MKSPTFIKYQYELPELSPGLVQTHVDDMRTRTDGGATTPSQVPPVYIIEILITLLLLVTLINLHDPVNKVLVVP